MAAHHEIHLETYPVKKLVETGWGEDLPDQPGAIDMPNVQRLSWKVVRAHSINAVQNTALIKHDTILGARYVKD